MALSRNNMSVGEISNQSTVYYSSTMYASSVTPPSNINLTQLLPTLKVPRDTPKYFTTMSISTYSRSGLTQINRTDTIASLVLPLPSKIIETNSVKYNDSFELGQLTGHALGTMQTKTWGDTVSNVFSRDQLGSILSSLSREALDILGSVAAAAGYANVSDYLMSIKTTAGDIASILSGWSPNQFMTVLLEGPTYRRYEMTFLLSPKTPEESENIRQIDNLLNNNMAPSLSSGGGFFSFPNIFQIGLHNNSKYLSKYKPSVLTDFNIIYTPNDVPAFLAENAKTDNLSAPESVILTMKFLELEFWVRGDFTDSNNITDTIGPRYE